jgi:uncharacterized protein (TIGR00255 family)
MPALSDDRDNAMIHSMTAFARQSEEFSWGSLVWEIRSVNHRYLEPSFKLHDSMRVLENRLRESLRNKLNRGKVECGLRLQLLPNAGSDQLAINETLMQQLIQAAEAVQDKLREPSPINPLQVLQWPGVQQESSVDSEEVAKQALAAFDKALEQLLEARGREGEVLKQFIEQRLDNIDAITQDVRDKLPGILQAQRDKLKNRLDELKAELDRDRLEQEMVILAQKADVDEELDRLHTHTGEVRRVLKKGSPCGRRLDFLMQELNREANTLSSKSIVSDTTQAAVELKVLIEQMREQIQNIE